jgi:hypothetical protein|tara:strand:- start:395 stop:559 length:165 start_codon:yes stop_codon:yes gene_type:complete
MKKLEKDYTADLPEDVKAKEEAKKNMWKKFYAKGGVIEKIPYRVTKEQLNKGQW